MKDSFREYHPIVNITYFAFVILCSMLIMHPLAQGMALIAASAYLISVDGKRSKRFVLGICVPIVLITSFVNPAFNHEGVTILLYFPNGNPLTAESIFYGLYAGGILVLMLLWSSNFNRVFTTDKFIYLFGRIIPALSLILSMTLRFIPKFANQMKVVVEGQRSMGRDISMGSLWKRMKIAIAVISIMITWSLENAIETADSMRSRGYGQKGRSAYSIYRFTKRDIYALIWIICGGVCVLIGDSISAFGFRYFPSIRYASMDITTIPFYGIYFGVCMTPVLLNIMEERKWKTLYSKM